MELPTHIVSAGAIVFNEYNKVLLVKKPRKVWFFAVGYEVDDARNLTLHEEYKFKR